MGYDRQGRSLCYTDYTHFFEVVAPRGLYELPSLYKEILTIYENQEKFIRWRIQVIERLIRTLSFNPRGVNSIILVQDYKHRDFKHRASRPLIDVDEKIFSILRDNYPGMISYMILHNVPWICRAVISLRSLFNGNESMKLVMSDEASVPETLYKYISPEHIPQLYSGIYGTDDNLKTVPVFRALAKGVETFTIKIEGIRAHAKVWWDVVAGGSYFEYSCRFVPDEEAILAKMVQNQVKEKRVSHCYTAKEPGKIVISINSRVTKLVSYRYKVQNLKLG
nr:hypothetical protein [Tanacetum cinerariifolium]